MVRDPLEHQTTATTKWDVVMVRFPIVSPRRVRCNKMVFEGRVLVHRTQGWASDRVGGAKQLLLASRTDSWWSLG